MNENEGLTTPRSCQGEGCYCSEERTQPEVAGRAQSREEKWQTELSKRGERERGREEENTEGAKERGPQEPRAQRKGMAETTGFYRNKKLEEGKGSPWVSEV